MVDTLYQHTFVLQLTNILVALVIAYLFRQYLPPIVVWLWLLAILSVSLTRLYLLSLYRRDSARIEHTETLLTRFRIGATLTGQLLSLPVYSLLYIPQLNLVFFMTLVVVGSLAGAVTSLSVDKASFRLYFIGLSLPHVAVMSVLGLSAGPNMEVFLSIALMLPVYSFMMYLLGVKTHNATCEGLWHRFTHETTAEALAREIEKREEAQEELMLSERVIANIREGIVITDRNNRIIRINETFSRITGYTPEDVVGKSPNVLSSGKQGRDFYLEMWKSLQRHDQWEGEIWNKRKNGEVYPEWLNIGVIRGADGEIHNYVGWFRDITERKREEERLSFLAHYDVLTGLANRKLFVEKLDLALADCRERGELLAVLFVDLNHFKQVNDNYGHDVGDLLLREVALRLKSILRPEDMVARLGGDEFILMLRNLHDGRDVESIAGKLLEAVQPEFVINGKRCEIGFAVGISLAPLDASERTELLRRADRAMYQAKRDRSRSQWCLYSAETDGEEESLA